jgi:hypothetical protein
MRLGRSCKAPRKEALGGLRTPRSCERTKVGREDSRMRIPLANGDPVFRISRRVLVLRTNDSDRVEVGLKQH